MYSPSPWNHINLLLLEILWFMVLSELFCKVCGIGEKERIWQSWKESLGLQFYSYKDMVILIWVWMALIASSSIHLSPWAWYSGLVLGHLIWGLNKIQEVRLRGSTYCTRSFAFSQKEGFSCYLFLLGWVLVLCIFHGIFISSELLIVLA